MDIKKEIRLILNIFLISIIIIAITGIAVFISYYFLVYLEPNFDDNNFNYIKTASPGVVKPDDEIQIELGYKNTGYREVKDFSLEFHIPTNTEFKISDQPGKYFKEKNLVLFESSNLKRNEGKKILITLATKKPLDNGTIIKFKNADIRYKISDNVLTGRINNDLVFRIRSAPEIKMSKLKLEDINGGDIRMGDEIGFTFNAENIGNMNATGVEAEAVIPPKTSIIEDSILPDNYEISENKILWKFNTFEINKPADFSFKIKIGTGFEDKEKISEAVSIISKQGDNLISELEGGVRLFPDLGDSKLTVTDKNGEYTWAGDTLTIKMLLKNNGERAARDIKLTCPVPENTFYIKNSAKSKKSEDVKISMDKNVLLFEIDIINVGEEREVSFELQVSPKMTGGGSVSTNFDLASNGIDFKFPNTELKVKANYKVTIACLGDSLVALSNWPQILDSLLESTFIHTDYTVIASGIRGETASGGFKRFDSSIAKYKPQIVIVGYGTNDIGSGTDRFSYYLNGIVGKARNINATIFLESLGFINTSKEPSKSDWQNYQKVIYQIGAANGVPVIDIYSPLSQNPGAYIADWVHYTPEGSSVVAHTIFNYVVQYLDSSGKRK